MNASFSQAYSAARHGTAIEFNHERCKTLINAIPIDFSGKTVLDVACGHENPFFGERLRLARHVIGLDGSAEEVSRNKSIHEKHVGNFHKMPLPDQCVDMVVSVDTIEHSTEPDKFLAECYRVLRPGGEAIFTTPNLFGYKNAFAKYCGKPVFDFVWRTFHNRKLEYDTCYRCNTAATFRARARNAGFEVLDIRYIPEISWFFAKYPFAFGMAHAYNLVMSSLNLINFWGYMVVSLAKPEFSNTA